MNLLAIPALASAAYQILTLCAGIRHLLRPRLPDFTPPISILKPVRGTDERFEAAIRSHALQDYPEFEILFGLTDLGDPAHQSILALARAYPSIPIRVIEVRTTALNPKVGVLEALARHARHPFLLVNDSDILVAPNYLRQAIAPLANCAVGLVTCLYRGSGGSFATRSESLGIATEFAPSVLLARFIGVNEFAMGSTLAFRAADLASAGGFAAISDYLGDDYQLGKLLTQQSLRVELGRPIVATWLGSGTWRSVWAHQLRWARTIRVSRPAGHFGYGITFTIAWAALAAVTGNLAIAIGCYATRIVCGIAITALILKDSASLARFWWMPFRDAFGFAIWIAALFGNTVEWRGKLLRIDPQGRITPNSAAPPAPTAEP